MKHLITYKLFEAKIEKVLYHGSPYRFSTFKPSTTFFSDTERFALEYAETKSMDMALDNEANIYTVKVKTELFDVNDKKDFKLLKNELPDEVEVFLTNFPIGTNVSKEEVLTRLKGYTMSKPSEEILNAKVGDEIELGGYNSRNKVYKIDNNFVYIYPLRAYQYTLDDAFNSEYNNHKVSKDEYTALFKHVRKFLNEYIKNNTDSKVIFDDKRNYYANRFISNSSDIDSKCLNNFKQIYNKALSDLEKSIIKDSGKKINKKVERVELDSTWRFFENEEVENIIKKHNYGGYVAKEDGVNTYAIFHPEKDVDILNYQFSQGMKFDTIDDYKKYQDLLEYSRTINKNVYEFDVYNWFKKGLSKVEVAIEIKKEMRIEKEYWSLIKGGMSAKEAKKKSELSGSVTEMKLYESVDDMEDTFYYLYNSLVYIDSISVWTPDEYVVKMRKKDGSVRSYTGEMKEVLVDFIPTNDSFELKHIKKTVKKIDNNTHTYNIVYYYGNKKVETLKYDIPKALAYPLRGKLARESRYKMGEVKVERNR